MNIYKIALTGGPCAGKTSVVENVAKMLEEEGYYVITIPETAASLIKSKMPPQGSKKHALKFQELVLLAQTTKEQITKAYCQSIIDNNEELLKEKKGIIILCDRGIIDNRAYLSQRDYDNLLKQYQYNELEILDTYDLVINLISTATAKPEEYKLNGIRYEKVEDAAKRDELTSGSWLLHRNLKVIMPTDTIEEKYNIVFSQIIDFIENKQNNETISFEVDKEKSDFSSFNEDNSRRIKITSFFIKNPNNSKFILDRRQSGENVSFLITQLSNNTPTTESKPINYDTYNELLKLNLLEKISEEDILYFIYNGNYFSIVQDNSEMRLYSSPDNILNIPKGIVLKKTLTK